MYWKRGKYTILYFPHFQYEESIKLSYFSRVQTIKQMVAGDSCCGELVVSDGVVSRKYKIFIFFSYPNRGNKTNGDWGGEWVVSDGGG